MPRVMILIVTIMLLASVSFGFAQQETFSLTETDYLLLTTANTLTGLANSYAFDFTLEARSSGVEDVSGRVELTGSGAVVMGLRPSLQLDVQGSVMPEGSTTLPLDLQTRIINEVFYINAAEFPAIGEVSWEGLTLQEGAEAFVEGVNRGANVSIDPSALTSGFDLTNLGIPGMSEFLSVFNAIPRSSYIRMSRAQDETVNGQAVAHFVIDVSLADLLSDEGIVEFLMTFQTPTPTVSQSDVQAMSEVIRTTLANNVVSVHEYINLSDGLVHRLTFDIHTNFDFNADGESSAAPITLDMVLNINLSRFNEPISIPVPAGAQLSPAAQALVLGVDIVPTPILPTVNVPTIAVPTLDTSLIQATSVVPTVDLSILDTPIAATSIPAAQSITANVPQTIQLSGGQAVSLSYTTTGPEVITVIVRSIQTGAVDTTLEVLNANGERLGFNDDHGTPRTDINLRDSVLENLSLPVAGTYTIRVNSFTGVEIGDVEVTLQAGVIAPSPTAVIDVSGSVKGTPIPPTGGSIITVDGTLLSNQTYKYTLEAVAGEVVTITVRDTSGTLDPRFTIRLNGIEVGGNDDHGTGDVALDVFDSRLSNFVLASGGTYIIEISDFFGEAGSFSMTIERS